MLVLLERVNEAQRIATKELKEMQANDPKTQRKRKDKGDDNLKSTEEEGRGMKGSSKKKKSSH